MRTPGLFAGTQGSAYPLAGSVLHEISRRVDVQRRGTGTLMTPWLALIVPVPLLFLLALVALLRARPEDIPAVVQALARWWWWRRK